MLTGMLTKTYRGIRRARKRGLTEVGRELLDETAVKIFRSGEDNGVSEVRAEARVVGGLLGDSSYLG